MLGLVAGLAYVCRSCACNAHNALCQRHGAAPPVTKYGMPEAVAYLRSASRILHAGYVSHYITWQRDWWTKWPLRKQLAMRASIAMDEVRPERVDAMVKREISHAAPSKARLIQYYPNMATQAMFGPEFYSLQKTYTEHFQRREVFPGVRVTFGSGMNADELGAWMDAVLVDVPNPHYYERDGKNWDSTMQETHFAVRMAAYEFVGDDFCNFVRAGYDVVGRDPRGALKYRLKGTVKSGHNDTTLGNSIVNAMLSATAMAKAGLRGDVIVAGDDLLAVIEGDFDEHALADAERDLGIKPEYRKFLDASDASFISGVWFLGDGKHAFAPKPGRLLARLFWTVRPPPPKRVREYCNGIVAGLTPTCGDMPVIGAFLAAHKRDDVETDAIAEWRYRTHLQAADRPSRREQLMKNFCARYGLTRAEVEECEAMFAKHKHQVGFISHPVIDKLMRVDLADVAERPTTREM